MWIVEAAPVSTYVTTSVNVGWLKRTVGQTRGVKTAEVGVKIYWTRSITGWWFQSIFIFTPICGR